MLTIDASTSIESIVTALNWEDNRKGVVGYLVYGDSTSYHEVQSELKKVLNRESTSFVEVDVFSQTSLELFGDSSDSETGVRILGNFESLPFLKPSITCKLPLKSAITSAYNRSEKGYNPKIDLVLGYFNKASDSVDKYLESLTTNHDEIKQNLFEILTWRPTKFITSRVSYDSSKMMSFIKAKGFKKLPQDQPLINLHYAAFALKFIQTMLDYRSFKQPTIIILSEETFKLLKSHTNNRMLPGILPCVHYVDIGRLPYPEPATIDVFTQWINE
jgi:hypothetical protein